MCLEGVSDVVLLLKVAPVLEGTSFSLPAIAFTLQSVVRIITGTKPTDASDILKDLAG